MTVCKHLSSIPKSFSIKSPINAIIKSESNELYICLVCMKECSKMTHMKQHSNQRNHLIFWMRLSPNYGCLFCCKCRLEILESSPSLLDEDRDKLELFVNDILNTFKKYFSNGIPIIKEEILDNTNVLKKEKRSLKRIEEKSKKIDSIISLQTPKGLKNLGNTCFMNSVLQLLSITSFLSENHEQLGPIRSSLFSLLTLLRQQRNPSAPLSPMHFFHEISNKVSFLEANEQQDSHDFIHLLFNSLEEEGKELFGRNDGIMDIFGGEIEVVVECCNCEYICRRKECLVDISIPLREDSILQGMKCMSINNNDYCDVSYIEISYLIRQWGKKELLADENAYQCPECAEDSKAHKQTIFRKFPSILIIHLQRFVVGNMKRTKRFNDCSIGYKKDNSPVDISYTITLGDDEEYDLIGAIIHLGTSPEFGHYVSLTKNVDGNFYLISDCVVTNLGIWGGDKVRSSLSKAYILFYQNRNK